MQRPLSLSPTRPERPALQVTVTALSVTGVGALALAIHAGLRRQGIEIDFTIFRQNNPVLDVSYGAGLLRGLALSAAIAAVAGSGALALGTLVAFARLSSNAVTRHVAAAWTEAVRNTPLLLQILAVNFAVIPLLPDVAREWLYTHNPELWAVTLTLITYTAAFVSETVRSGIQGVPRGQREAGLASGLSEAQVQRRIVFPQALSAAVPPLGSLMLNLAKNSSLASQIGVTELFFRGAEMQSATFRGLEAITGVTLGYVLLSAVITALFSAAERHLGRHRKAA